MAAVLKKRALAEYSHSQTVTADQESAAGPSVKKVRLTRRSEQPSTQAEGYLQILQRAKTSRESLQALTSLAELSPAQVEDVGGVVRRLLEVFSRDQETAVRCAVLRLVQQLVSAAGERAHLASAADELTALLERETSSSVAGQCLSALSELGALSGGEARLSARLVAAARPRLSHASHQVAARAAALLGRLLPVSPQPTDDLTQLGEATRAQDPRVRCAALQALLTLHGRGLSLGGPLYADAVAALRDDYESVREAGLQLVHVLAQTAPERLVPLAESDQTVRLVDDAFGHICNAINDLSVRVRVRAATLLGSMTAVSTKFLEQTLDKKLMSNMRRKRSGHERLRTLVVRGEWSSGKKWGDDAPKEQLQADTVSLMSSGACGAFVHGLEDEFLEVRSAALESMTELATLHPHFAEMSLDFIVDMFNDEIAEVRLRAVDSLSRIGQMITLREDQLDEILAVLEVYSIDTREGLHRMLGDCRLGNTDSLKLCVEKLLKNLKRYPQDKRSLWRCFQRMGAAHPDLVLPLVPSLLHIHPYFQLPEQDVQDPAYVCILLLVMNAAAGSPTMMALLDDNTRRHFLYLRDTLPGMVPDRLPGQAAAAAAAAPSPSTPAAARDNAAEFLQSVLRRAAEPGAGRAALEQCRRDLDRLAQIDSALSARAQFASTYIHCQLLMAQVTGDASWRAGTAAGPARLQTSADTLTALTLRLQHRFSGLEADEWAAVRQLRLRLLALRLVLQVRGRTGSALALGEHFLEQAQQLERHLVDGGQPLDAFTEALVRGLEALEERKAGAMARVLAPLLTDIPVPPLRLRSPLTQAEAVIFEPRQETEHPQKFTAGLVLGIPLDCELRHVSDVSQVRLRVQYPDQRAQLVLPRATDFRPLDEPASYRLRTTVLVSHQVWSEDGEVEISVVLDVKEPGCKVLRQEDWLIALCDAVRVAVQPRAVRRNVI
ncbi:integrator complex subunit 4-like [Amphibalanus amphitrite]|uniref:integrator complex subunit 4-like n=1 Tax=Amphibalanus amphitrite TaxID=1232801 RepID=UPI001C919890|nr:integrator complex subunit 4-like [Amphibalanus amphitrite]XP_043224558.1 integrator complex subunit 4-like [Amphibalanus amphitrite]